MRVFRVLDNKSIVNAEKWVVLDPNFWYDSLIEIGVKIDVFELFLSKRIVKTDFDCYFLV